MISFFKIIGKKSILLELYHSYAMKIDDVFYPNLFEKISINLLISLENELAPLLYVYNEEK